MSVPDEVIGKIGRCPQRLVQFKVDRGPKRPVAAMSRVGVRNAKGDTKGPKQLESTLVRRARPDDVPEQRDRKREIRQTPFFVEEGAVVDCPWCERRLRVSADEFNEELECPGCD